MSNHKIKEEIKRVKAEYSAGQVERSKRPLSISRHKELLALQISRQNRLKHLGNLLTQRVTWN